MMMPSTLSDEHLAAIAWADHAERTADLARRIGAPYMRVYRARRQIQAAGGWWCPLALGTCTECERPLLYRADTIPRQVHPDCEQARITRYRRQYRAEGRPHALSTPYTRAWRQRHPERVAEQYADPEVLAASLAQLRAARDRDQAVTRARADRHNRWWTADEDALVLANRNEADRELALELGRSLIALHAHRSRLRKRLRARADEQT